MSDISVHRRWTLTSLTGNKPAFLLPTFLLLLTVLTVVVYRLITQQSSVSGDVISPSTVRSSEYQTNTSRRLAQLDLKYTEGQRQLTGLTEQQANVVNSAVTGLFAAAKRRDAAADCERLEILSTLARV